jgi:hypothetical protein
MRIELHRQELTVTGVSTDVEPGGKRRYVLNPKLHHRQGSDLSAACARGQHSACYKLRCVCPCGHRYA